MNKNTPLSVEAVSFAYAKKQILDRVSFAINPGSFSVLLGANGAGKTTLFSLITRLYSPKLGRIVVYGEDINQHPEKALVNMGVVFQNPTLDQDLTIRQNLNYYAALYGISAKQARQLVNEQMPKYLPECDANQKIHQLSGGQKRRVELMRSLMHQPKLLLLDEPTVGLDIKSREAFIQNVRSLCVDSGIGVLWATHLVDEVGQDDQVIVLHNCRIQADGHVQKLLSDSQSSDIGQAFLKLTGINSDSLSDETMITGNKQ